MLPSEVSNEILGRETGKMPGEQQEPTLPPDVILP